ncbi:diguanylate cyclase [Shewanella sp. WXL01]|nr:GGDEF domain-containing protein [Shewanella sp. WXL01]NKF49023.1 diguanylate cyclase [Shewanella sp. WXL01]
MKYTSVNITPNSVTEATATEKNVAERILYIAEDHTMLPADIAKEAEQLLQLSKQKNWLKNEVMAAAAKASMLSYMEDIPEALSLINRYLPIAQTNHYKSTEIRLRLAYLTASDAMGQSDEALQQIQHLLDLIPTISDQTQIGRVYLSIAEYQYAQRDFGESLTYMQKAYQLFAASDHKVKLSDTLNALANLYNALGDRQSAISYYQQALAMKQELKDDYSTAVIAYNLGTTYSQDRQFDLAKQTLALTIELTEKTKDDVGTALAQMGIAGIALKQGKTAKAIELFSIAKSSFEQIGVARGCFQATLGLHDAFYQTQQYQRAREQLEDLQQLAQQLDLDDFYAKVSKREADNAAIKGDFEQAYIKLLSFHEQTVDKYEQEKQGNIQQLKVRFDTEIAQQQNQLLQKQNQVKQLQIEQQSNQRLVLILAVLVGGIMLFYQFRNRQFYRNLAMKDSLTSAANRRAIISSGKQKCACETNSTTVVLVDLDNFKSINDTYGHDTGDEVLIAFAHACRQTMRKHDEFGRYGGEEWLLLLDRASEQDVIAVMRRIHNTLNKQALNGYPKDKVINFSCGVAVNPAHESHRLDTLINLADERLYQAKQSGRNAIGLTDQVVKIYQS